MRQGPLLPPARTHLDAVRPSRAARPSAVLGVLRRATGLSGRATPVIESRAVPDSEDPSWDQGHYLRRLREAGL